MKLRQGRTKSILQSSVNSALLAVEVYNKPRATFRSECYITLMMMAWMRLFHAYFNKTIGNKYYYKDKNNKGQYELIDGEPKAWELGTCINKYSKLSPSIIANLKFFIGLRNKIEHRHIDEKEVDVSIFGECQALLYNYENTLIDWFGEEYGLNENLAFSLQFSSKRKQEQKKSNKKLIKEELIDIQKYIEDYRTALSADVFNSQEYSVKVLLIPKISNSDRKELAVEFVRWNDLDEENRQAYKKLLGIIKDKVIVQEAINVQVFSPKEVREKVLEKINLNINDYHHKCLYYVFSIRPTKMEGISPETTNEKYCVYDFRHKDYSYKQEWIDFLCELFTVKGFNLADAIETYKKQSKIDIKPYE